MTKAKYGITFAVAMVLSATSVYADTWTFITPVTNPVTPNTISNPGGNSGFGSDVNNEFQAGSGIKAEATAWANTANGTSGSSTNNTVLSEAYLTPQGTSGLGVKNQDACSTSGCTGDYSEGTSPEHAIDNDQRKDAILFTFNDSVNLESVSFGWVSSNINYKDSDFSVYAYTGVGVGSVDGLTYTTDAVMLAASWKLVGHYEGGSTTGSKSLTTGMITGPGSSGIFSSYWLIGASNGTSDYNNTTGHGKDAFKLSSISGSAKQKQVPEPGTLLLMGAGLLGLTRINSRRLVRSAS